jgi:hypothetical protein
MVTLRLMALACVLIAPLASAQIYKCPGKDGSDLYQNFPCDIDSIGSTATKPAAENNPTLMKPIMAANAPSVIASAAKVVATSDEPRIGMTTDEVRAIWGDPTNDVNSEVPEGLIEIWSYAGGRAVQFDYKGSVTVINR